MTIFPLPGNLTHKGLVGSYGALLVGWSVVEARGLYLARHLFTLFYIYTIYIGCTTDFKTRWRHHDKSFNNPDYKHETVLSTHIWECKSRGSTWKVKWKILDRGQPFNPVTNVCKLCVREQFYILRKPNLATLNHRQEIGTFCPHIRSSLLRNIKKVKVPD